MCARRNSISTGRRHADKARSSHPPFPQGDGRPVLEHEGPACGRRSRVGLGDVARHCDGGSGLSHSGRTQRRSACLAQCRCQKSPGIPHQDDDAIPHLRGYPSGKTQLVLAGALFQARSLDVANKAWVKAGDTTSVREAVLGMIVPSANDAAAAMAEKLGGSEIKFAALMNAKHASSA